MDSRFFIQAQDDEFRKGNLNILAITAFYFTFLVLLFSAGYAAIKMVDRDELPLKPRTRFKFFKNVKNINALRFEKLEKNIETLQKTAIPSHLALELSQLKENCAQFEKKYLCPIGRFIMSDPVTLSSGIAYERNNIARWLAAAKKTRYCPVSRKTLRENTLPATSKLIQESIQEELAEYEDQFKKIAAKVGNSCNQHNTSSVKL